MNGQTAKTKLRDRILLAMKNHISSDEMNVLEQVLTKELSGVNVEDITTLPAELRDSVDEQNRMIVEAFKYKKRALKERTKENYLNAVYRLVTLTGKVLTQIDELDVYNYLQWYERKNISVNGKKNQNTTINNERLYLSAFFSWMRKDKFRVDNPVESVEKRKTAKKPIDYFKQDEMAKLKDACTTERERAIIEVLRSTGARVGEIEGITRDMVDWQTGDIMIQGEKGDRYRTIYLDTDARHYLKKYLDTRSDRSPFLFVSNRGSHNALKKTGIRSALKRVAKISGVKCRVYPHKLRKTLGMNLKNKGVDIGIIQEVLGHANPAVNLQRLVLQALFVLPEFLRDTQGYRGKARGCQVVLKVPLSSVHFHSYNFFLPFALGAGE